MKYVARKTEKVGPISCIITGDGVEEELENYGFHSPDGFQIGYSGSGPADLAYSVLVDYYIRLGVPEVKARRFALDTYQDFKEECIAPAQSLFIIETHHIASWLKIKKVEV